MMIACSFFALINIKSKTKSNLLCSHRHNKRNTYAAKNKSSLLIHYYYCPSQLPVIKKQGKKFMHNRITRQNKGADGNM